MKRRSLVRSSFLGPLLGLALLAGCGSGSPPPAPPPSLGAVANFAVPPAVADIPLTTSSGRHLTLASLRGRVVVLADFLSLCSEVCPMVSANLATAARSVPRQPVVFLEVSVDPRRDSVARLAAYRRLYGQLPANWVLATGRPADLARLWHFFHVYYAVTAQPHPPARDWWTGRPLTYDVSHSDLLVFLDQTGRERFLVEGGGNTLGGLPPARLAATLTAQGKSNLYHPDPAQTWTVPQLFSVVSWLLGRRV